MAFRKKRLLAIVLAAMMTIQLCPTLSFASENADDAVTVQAETVEQEEAKEAETVEEAKEEEAEPAAEEKQEEAEPSAEEKQEEAEPSAEEEAKAEEEAEPAAEEETKAEEKAEPAAEEASESAAKEETGQQSAEEESGATQQPAEEAAAAASTEQPAEEVFTAGELVFHGHDYDVTLEYDEAAKISASAELKVKEIVKGSSEYESYLKGAEAAADKGVAEARFFDITIWADGKEVQPESPVKVNISYKEAIEVAEEGEIQAMHFKDGSKKPEVIDSDTNSGREVDEIKFEADSFSVYGVIYTVDFTYDGYTFSMPGEGTILLSELAKKLNLYEKDLDKSFSVKNVKDVSFTDYDLVKLEKQADGDWLLTSLAPFSSEETLTVTMKDGVKFVIGVTDEQVSSNLTDFLTNAVITGATQDSEGKYKVEAGKEYNIILSFAENSAHQFDNRATLTYTMPDGLTILSQQTGDLKVNIVYKGRTYQVDATYDLGTDGNLEIKFDENDPDFHHLENTTNVSFRFSYNGAFDGSEDKIHFSEDIERDIVFDEPEPGQAYVSKSGTFDEETGKFSYTITVNATGDVTNVNVKDVISGNALSFNNDVQVSGNSSSYRDNGAANGFDYTFASMREGEVITITYSASVDFSKDTDKDGKITVDQTKNTATVKPEGGEPHTSEYSHEIAFKTTKKSNGENTGTTADGDKIYKWTITYNELRLASAGGDTIKDTIAADSTEYMKYYGDGLSINVIDKNGSIVDTRNVPYSALQSYSDSSWTYKIPEGDSQPYMYEITYYTVVDMEKVEGTGNTVTVTNDANGTSGGADVTPESVISVTKSVDSFTTEKVNWSVMLGIPETGLTQAVVTDTFPAIWLNNRNIYDLLEDGSLQITGLLDGESYSLDTDTQGKVKITFFQDPGKRITGLKATPGGHTITVKLTTLVDQEWLQKGYETGGYEQNHTNSVDFNGKTDTATVTFGKPGIEKKGDALTDSEGNVTGLKYTVVLKGVSETPVSVLDTFDTNILEVDTAKASSWDHMRIWGGNQYSQDAGRMPVSYTDTGDGIILTADSVPMQTDGSYYPYYKIVYYLKVKDGVDLKALAIANGGEYDVDNTVKWGDHESKFTYKVEYDYLDKQLLNEGELGGTSRTAKYQITFNPSKATLNEGSDMTMTDVLSANLSVDYSSIKIETDPAGQNVIYSLSGGDGGTTVATYTIPDSTKVTITYDANVRGNGSQTIVNKVSVNGKEETVQNTKSYGSASEGEGAQASFKIVKVDGYDANKKLQGVKFRVFCENPDVDFGDGQKELILVTDENGEITLDGEAYTLYFNECYHVQEIEGPEDYGTISFDYLVTLTNDMSKVDYGHYIYYFSDSMQIKNWPLEGLVVEKQVESDDEDDLDRYYKFRISILDEDGNVDTTYNSTNGDDTFVGGVAEFELKNKEQKMFWGFEKGTRYKVEEIFEDEEGNEFTTTVSYDVYDDEGKVIEHKTDTSTSHEGALTQDDEVLVFTNTRTETGSLKIKKNVTVEGKATEGTEADGTYEFTIKGPGAEGTVSKTVTITVTNGVAASATVDGEPVDLDSDKYVEVANLEAGEYTITETAPTNDTYLVGENGKKVTVVAGESGEEVSATAEFTNNKPGTPEFEKKIQDTNDSTGETSGWQDSADYDIGDAVPYKLTATLPDDVSTNESYSIMFEDTMESTLTFAGVSKVTLNDDDITDECTITPASGGQSFTVSKSWSGDDVKTLDGATVEVYFTATLNDSASIGSEGNVNAARLHYDNKSEITPESGKTTDWDYVIAFTYKLDVNKVDQDGEALTGAEFKLEKKLEDGTTKEIDLTESGNVFTGKGLDDGDYVLTETTAPTGYKPIDPIEFTVTADHEVVWDYTSAELAFNGDGRTAILTALTGETDSGDLEFAAPQSVEGLEGTVTNQKLGSLKVKKNVLVNGEPTTGTSADGTYTFVIKDESGEQQAVATITIVNGVSDVAQVDNLPVGKYIVSEDVTKNPAGMALVGQNDVEVEVAADQTAGIPIAVFTNDKTEVGSMKIKKNVTVNGEATTKTIADGTYTFNVKDKDGVTKATETITIVNGVSDEVQIDNLPTGKYTVSEDTSFNPEGMSIVGENDIEVEVTADETAEIPTAEFTNNIDVGSLKIKKNVTVNGAATTETEADGDYSFVVKDAEGTAVATQTITITNGASNEIQVDDLVPGTYTVSEVTDSNPDGMVLITDNDVVIEVTAGKTAEVKTAEFTNNKPGTPEFEKKIQDTNDSTGETSRWQDSADYDIGDAVPYKLTATLPNDVSTNESYSIKFEDQMESTLTFAGVSKVTLNDDDITDECTITPASGGQSFTVSKSWTGDAVTEALDGATVEVFFTATLNDSASIGSEGNVNAARLHYDNKAEITPESGKTTDWDYVIAFTYKLDVNKVDQDGEALEGAEFKLEKKLADGTTKEIDLTNTGNVFTGKGLDDGTYVLTETKTPAGYKPIDPIEFTVTAEHEIIWDYTSEALNFNGTGRTAILTALTGDSKSGDLEFDEEKSSLDGLVGNVTNEELGSLKLKKLVTVNGAAATGTEADGSYTFTVKGPGANGAVTKTVVITVTNGTAVSAAVDGEAVELDSDGYAEVAGLEAGEYTITETAPTNGTYLVGKNGKKVTVVAGKSGKDVSAKAEFTNNKPGTPEFEKKIQDTNDSTGDTSGWQDSADYDIGDEVPYKLTATLPNDVSTNKNYSIKFEDQMESTLTFKGVSKVTLNGADITSECTIDPATGGQTFTVSKNWTGDAVTEELNGATVEVYFTATLNENAKIGSEGNVNAARLHYDNKAEITPESGKTTDWDYVIAFTYKLDVNKVDQDGEALEGAEFKLEKKLADGTTKEIDLTNTGNVFTGKGLDDGTYVLTETKTPAGYKPIDPIEFTVTAEHEVIWDYTSEALNFNGTGRTAILTALTGDSKSGDLEFDEEKSSLDGLVGNVTNEELGSLKITKNVLVNGKRTTGTSADGTYTFIIRDNDGKDVKTAVVTITNGASNTVQVDGLAAGTYKVSEDTTKNPEGMTITGSNEVEVTVTAGNTSEIPTAVFTNDKTEVGSLKIRKNVTVNGKATTKTLADGTYTFKVTDAEGNTKATETITITNGASNEVQIDNLPTGTYTVSEDTALNPDGMTLTSNNDIKVVVTADKTAEIPTAAFTNNKEVGSLKVKKSVTVNGAAATGTEADGSYTFTVKGPGANGAVTKTVVITVTNGTAVSATVDGEAVELDSDGYAEVSELKVGEYTITETAPTNGTYLVGENGKKVTVVAGKSGKDVSAKAEFTNNKPGTPEFEKKIQDTNDSTGDTSGWQDSADYDIGDEVPYKLTATLPNDVSTNKNYSIKFEDKMENTLTFKGVSKVTLNGADITSECTIEPATGGQTFTVSKSWTGDAVTEELNGAKVEVYFTATLNDNAKIGSEGNVNAARLHYDNKSEITPDSGKTPWDYVIAFTYKLDINKVDQDGEALTGAEFKLEKVLADKTKKEVTLSANGNVFTGEGLDDGTYVLTETKTPAGYKPIDPIEFTVTAEHEVIWDYTSEALNFNGTGRTDILTALTGATKSGDLKFAETQSVEELKGTVKNQGQGAIKIEKIVTGTEIKDKDFTFKITLTAPEGTKLESSYAAKLDGKDTERAKVGKDGVVTVTIKAGQTYEITELPAGTKYVVTEVTPLPGGYSEGTHKGTQDTIEVGKTKNVTMNNIYKSSGEIKIKAKKALNGRPLEDKQFTFELMDEAGKVIQTVQNSSDGTVEFESISYTQADITSWDAETGTGTGSKKYKVKETIETKDGYTYDETKFDITVTLTDNGAGIITAAQAPELKDLVFTNEYKAEGEVVLGARKELVGKTIKADQFSFELKDAEGKVLQTRKNAADGSVTFDAIKYTQDDIYEKDAETGVYSGASTKTYNYTINEVIPEGATPSKSGGNTFEYKGYTFDATVYTVAVVLKDNGDGTITATASPDAESLAFTNAYGAAGTLKLDAEKTFKNGTLKGDEFTFELKDADGKVLQSKKNDAAGNVSFDLITYKMEDLAKSPFKYTVSEVTGDKEDVKYDNTVYTVTVTLKDNDDGTLSVTKEIEKPQSIFKAKELKFVNEQLNVNTSITLGGVKVLQGQTLKANQFKFVLTDENGKKISTARNDADGNFTFKEISYKLSDLNGEAERVYTYKVSEVKGSMSNVTYDTRVYTVKVTVTDNGDGTMTATADLDKKSIKFVNKTVTKKKTTSKKSGTKKSSGTKRKGAGTGDNSPLGLLFGGLVIGAAGIAALLWARKKRNKKS